MPISIVQPGGQPSDWVSEEHRIMATDVIAEDGVYTDALGNSFQYRKGHVLPPGELAGLKKVGPFPEAEPAGTAEMAATQASDAEKAAADAKAKADADAKAKADADAKAATAPDNKQASAPENKSQ